MTVPAYLGLGSNLDDPKAHLIAAMAELATLDGCRILARSSLFRTQPVGPQPQPDYINAAVKLETSLDPEALLDALQAIETTHGRVRSGPRWGARTLDLDLLVYASVILDSERLTVPHPRMHERRFVLIPLLEIEPDLTLPDGRSLAGLLELCPALEVERLAP